MNRTLLPALLAVAALAGCTQDSSVGARPVPTGSPHASPSASSSPSAAPLDYNPRFGSNRFAAEAAIAVGRRLYSQGGQSWELNVRTDPLSLPGAYDPATSGQRALPAKGAKSISVFMATESGAAINVFRTGGVAHEKTELTDMAVLLETLFPGATAVTIQIYFGEANHYATGIYSGGSLDFRLMGPP